MRPTWSGLARTVSLLAALTAGIALSATAPARANEAEDVREQAVVDALRREDPAIADRYVALRDARRRAVEEYQRAERTYNATPPDVRGLFLAHVRQARRTYAETSLALLEFLEARDRRAIAAYQDEIERLKRLLEEHARTRADLQKLLE